MTPPEMLRRLDINAQRLVQTFLKKESPECTCAEDFDSLCPVYNHVDNENKLIQEISNALKDLWNEAKEEDAKDVEGHRCDVTCGDPFMGKLYAKVFRERKL